MSNLTCDLCGFKNKILTRMPNTSLKLIVSVLSDTANLLASSAWHTCKHAYKSPNHDNFAIKGDKNDSFTLYWLFILYILKSLKSFGIF